MEDNDDEYLDPVNRVISMLDKMEKEDDIIDYLSSVEMNAIDDPSTIVKMTRKMDSSNYINLMKMLVNKGIMDSESIKKILKNLNSKNYKSFKKMYPAVKKSKKTSKEVSMISDSENEDSVDMPMEPKMVYENEFETESREQNEDELYEEKVQEYEAEFESRNEEEDQIQEDRMEEGMEEEGIEQEQEIEEKEDPLQRARMEGFVTLDEVKGSSSFKHVLENAINEYYKPENENSILIRTGAANKAFEYVMKQHHTVHREHRMNDALHKIEENMPTQMQLLENLDNETKIKAFIGWIKKLKKNNINQFSEAFHLGSPFRKFFEDGAEYFGESMDELREELMSWEN